MMKGHMSKLRCEICKTPIGVYVNHFGEWLFRCPKCDISSFSKEGSWKFAKTMERYKEKMSKEDFSGGRG